MSSGICRAFADSIRRFASKPSVEDAHARTLVRLGRIAGLAVLVGAAAVAAQQGPPPPVSAQDLLDGLKADGSRWLTFGGNYANHRHSPLTSITPANVNRLQPQWTFQTATLGNFETTPLLRDNVLYVTGPQNVAWAIDARTGRQIWRYRRELPAGLTACCGLVNRGFGCPGRQTLHDDARRASARARHQDGCDCLGRDARGLQARLCLHAGAARREGKSDRRRRRRRVRDSRLHRCLRCADRAARVALLHGSRAGEPGHNTWSGDSWQRGGAGLWVTGAYDPELNLVYYGTGNPGPDYHSGSREGDNLYSCSLVAIDADTGKIRWHYQFTPHDVHDWDSTEVPVLADLTIAGQPRKVLMFANRNGFFYTLDRTDGKLILGKPFVTTTWAKQIDNDGRPHLEPGHVAGRKGRDHLSGHYWRNELLAADLRSGLAPLLRQRARSLRDVLRVDARVQGRGALHGRRRAAHHGVRHEGVRRAPRDRSEHGRAALAVRVSLTVDRRSALDRLRVDLQR